MMIFGYFILPTITLLYASQATLMNENFTGIANHQNQQFLFALWALMTASYFLRTSLNLFKAYQWHPPYLKYVSPMIFLGISLAPWIPYQDSMPHLETLHVFMAMGASVLFLILLGFFITYLQTLDLDLYHKYEPPFRLIILTLVILLLWSGHVNSLIEIWMTCSLSIYITYLHTDLKT